MQLIRVEGTRHLKFFTIIQCYGHAYTLVMLFPLQEIFFGSILRTGIIISISCCSRIDLHEMNVSLKTKTDVILNSMQNKCQWIN